MKTRPVGNENESKLLTLDGFTGDVYLLVKLLLPGAGKKRVYNLQSKQIVKILSQVHQSHDYHVTTIYSRYSGVVLMIWLKILKRVMLQRQQKPFLNKVLFVLHQKQAH